MTPDAFVDSLRDLVAASLAAEAGELTSKHMQTLASLMTSEQIVEVADLMEWVDTMLDLDAAAEARLQSQTVTPASRGA